MSFSAFLRRWTSSFFAVEAIAAFGGELIGFGAGFEVLERSFLPLLTLMRLARSDYVSLLVKHYRCFAGFGGIPELFFSPVIAGTEGSEFRVAPRKERPSQYFRDSYKLHFEFQRNSLGFTADDVCACASLQAPAAADDPRAAASWVPFRLQALDRRHDLSQVPKLYNASQADTSMTSRSFRHLRNASP
jgi:hypothetical protein